MKKIYVGNLAYSTQEDQLKSIFSECGTVVDAKIITDRETNRSKGFGFVEFESEDAVLTAVEKFNGYELDGRSLRVSEAREQRGGGGGRRSSGGGNKHW